MSINPTGQKLLEFAFLSVAIRYESYYRFQVGIMLEDLIFSESVPYPLRKTC